MHKSEGDGGIPKLTPIKAERYNSLLATYSPEIAYQLILLVDGRGNNSWKSVLAKIALFTHSDYKTKEYKNSLGEAFELDVPVLFPEIIQKVSEVRTDMKLDSYGDRIKFLCEQDFLNLFIVENVYEEAEGSKRPRVIGYKPVFKLKPE